MIDKKTVLTELEKSLSAMPDDVAKEYLERNGFEEGASDVYFGYVKKNTMPAVKRST